LFEQIYMPAGWGDVPSHSDIHTVPNCTNYSTGELFKIWILQCNGKRSLSSQCQKRYYPHRSFGAHCPRMLIVQRKHAIELSSLTKGNGAVSQRQQA
jgi:hypothetical protein